MSEGSDFGELAALIGYAFKDESLPRRALSHRSAVEQSEPDSSADNERLEFLGDSVLGFEITRMLFFGFPGRSEGDLTKYRAMLVCKSTLADKARSLRLGDFLLLGRGEAKTGGRDKDSLLAGAFEALIGAIYIDGGEAASARFVELFFRDDVETLGRGVYPLFDHKSTLQEYCHQEGLGEPSYKTVLVQGPPHDRTFEVAVLVNGQAIAQGSGKTKKTAQKHAAGTALKVLGFPA